MDSRQYFRDLFGLKIKDDYDKPTKYSTSATPPPPAEDVWARDPNDTPKQFFEQQLPGMIHIMEEVFRGIEKSMKDMGPMFQSPSTPGFGSIIGIVDKQRLPTLPTPTDKADADSRSLVLKDDDTGRTTKPSHYGPPVEDNSGTRYCDERGNSQVVPQNQNQLSMIPLIPDGWGSWSSAFEVEGSYSFINGKWVGNTTSVRETNEGKETTTYTHNEKGELVTTTEFTP